MNRYSTHILSLHSEDFKSFFQWKFIRLFYYKPADMFCIHFDGTFHDEYFYELKEAYKRYRSLVRYHKYLSANALKLTELTEEDLYAN